MHKALLTPRGQVSLRPAAAEDVEAYRDLRLEALRLHPEAFGQDFALVSSEPKSYWLDRLRQNSGDEGVIWVAEAAGQWIGMTGVRRGPAPKAAHSGLVWGVYVRPGWRCLRIADALIEAGVEWARSRGVRLVKLAVVTTNAAAIRCYARCGFSAYGVEPEALCVDGVTYDQLLMARRV